MKEVRIRKKKKKTRIYRYERIFSALYKLIVAKTENLELESKLNKQFMKDVELEQKSKQI